MTGRALLLAGVFALSCAWVSAQYPSYPARPAPVQPPPPLPPRTLPPYPASPAPSIPAKIPQNPPDPGSPSKARPLELYGSLADSEKAAAAPPSRVIVTEKAWVALQMAWGIKDPPKVEFDKQLLIVATTRSDKLVIETKLDADGDLRITALDNKDERGGFRYGIKAIDRAGVKTVDGRPLPVE